jgi:hypothetical protein
MIFSPSRVVLAAARKAKAPLAPAKKAVVVKKAAAMKKAVKNSVPSTRNKPVKNAAVIFAPSCVPKPAEVVAAVPAATVVPAADVVATMLDNTVMRVPMPAQSTLSTVAAPSAPRPAVEPLTLKTGDKELTAVCITAALELNQNGLFF